jgi:predicted NBD/HSP70 family sugar kinase
MTRVKIKGQTVAAIEADLLKRVRRHGHISRVALSRELHIVPSTVGIYVDRLLAEGFLVESRKAAPRLGRPATLLALNPDGGRYVGLDFEARNLMATAVDFSQQPLRQVHKTIRGTDSVAQILQKMERAIEEVMADDPRPVLGIGVGVPGVIDLARAMAVRYELIKGWQDIPLGERLRRKFGAPVFLENNIRCMALAELWFGGGRGLKDFICVGVRSGIAASVIANGHLLRGARNQAGEIGHWPAPVSALLAGATKREQNSGFLCRPGVRLEQVASLAAILRLAQDAKDNGHETLLSAVKTELSIDDLFHAMLAGDAYACSLIDSTAWVLGWVVSQLCALFDTQKVIFTGRLVELGDRFLTPVRAAAAQWTGTALEVEITGSALGTYNGALGAAALALQQWKPKR